MVRVRGNANRMKTTNQNKDETNPPPFQKETGGETSSSRRAQNKGETYPSPPQPQEETGGETSSPRAQNEGETNPPSSAPPPQEETREGEIVRRETSSPTRIKHVESEGRNVIRVTIDRHSLECDICSDPLYPPIYRCMLGHIACLLCWEKKNRMCPTCNKLIVGQNIALEAVLESIRLPCPNANLGCCKSLSYSQMQLHNDRCEFTQSVCPIPGCAHEAFSGQWQAHFLKDHWYHDCEYSDDDHLNYGESFTIRFDDEDLEEDRYYTVLGSGKDVFLLVKEAIPNVGNALSLFYIDLPDMGRNYVKCKLRVKGGPYRTSLLQSKLRVVSIKEWKKAKCMVLLFCYHHGFCCQDI